MASASTTGAESLDPPVSPAYSSFLDVPLQQLLLVEPPPSFIARTKIILSYWSFGAFFSILGLVFVTSLYLLHIIAFCYVRYRLYRPVSPNPNLPGVSIIKPIIGTDKNLYENLETFFTTQYHQFELLFCFNSTEDAAVQVVEGLIRKYPEIDAKLFFKGEHVGLNPKINNMMPAYRVARYPLIMISDSAIFMRPEGVLDMATTIMNDPKMALVTQTPYCKDRKGFDAEFEQVYFGTSHGRIYLSGNCMEFVCPTGMSSMVKKDLLEECGGLAAFGKYLAEDYFIGRELANRGYKSTISSLPALQNNATVSIHLFMDRICRWVKLRTAMLPHIVLVEPMQDCFPAGLIIACSLHYLFDFDMIGTLILHTVFWVSMDFMLMQKIQNGKLCIPLLRFLAIWLLRELSSPLVFIKAAWDPRIRWRNNVFHLSWGGKIARQST